MVLNPFNKKSIQALGNGNILGGLQDVATGVLDLVNYDTKISNDTNLAIANKNYGLQQQMFEYNKALQDKIFEREDTAYQRTAQDMLNSGLNPLSMQGTDNAGEVIASDTPQINYQNQKYDTAGKITGIVQTLAGLQSTFDQISTNKLQRDAIQTQITKDKYETLIDALKKGIIIDWDNKKVDFNDSTFDKWYNSEDKKLDELSLQSDYNIRNMQHDIDSDRYPSDTNFERTVTAVIDWLAGDRSEKAWNNLKKKYPLLQLFEEYFKDFMTPKYEVSR